MRRLTVVLALVLFFACGDFVGPRDLSLFGSYQLDIS